MSQRELIIEGARQNNLKDISLRLPHNQVIAVTGVSGSGKSSLAFDTIFAEGQWRFIESLSTYARLFLEKLDRPDVDAIRNIRPAIALEQKNPVKGSRSTVGTLTELYDLLRILYSRVATPYCPICGKEIRRWDPSQIAAELLEKFSGERAVITFSTGESLEGLKQKGFQRIWADNTIKEIDELRGNPPLGKGGEGGFWDVVLDRLMIRDEPRLSDSLETAWKEGKERLSVIIIKRDEENRFLRFSSRNACDDHNIELPEPSPILFSFNHPVCACPECKGFGNVLIYDEELIIPDPYLSLSDGAIELWEREGYHWWKEQLIKGAKKSGISVKKPYNELLQDERGLVFNGNPQFEGIKAFFDEMEARRYKLHVRVLLSRFRTPRTCPRCGGKRLCETALSYKIQGLDIAELCDIPIDRLSLWFDDLELSPMQRDIAKDAITQIRLKLRFLSRVGLDYLTLSRQTKTLSGGEYQRVNLSNQLASALTGTLYVLDEPTIGLHPRDTRRVAEIMRELSSLGNTVVVVEHDKDIISSSDWVVEMGPGGGHMGGEIVFSGPMEEFRKADTLTAHYIRGDQGAGTDLCGSLAPAPDAFITLSGATGNNLREADLRVPLKRLTVVTGVSGSGKSSLVVETFYHALARHFRTEQEQPLPFRGIAGLEEIRGVQLIDQSPIGKTPRSNPATYLKIFDAIRKLFSRQPEAKAHSYTPGFFSFNVPGGRCESCKGEGYQKMEMYFFEDIFVRCEDCKGRRYRDDALRVTYKGKTISDVLEMTVDEAADFFSGVTEIGHKMALMEEMGLGYLRLGQPATTLSGGEAQRLKVCAELSSIPPSPKGGKKGSPDSKGILYILDEPTVGLHHRDVLMFMRVIRRLVDTGNTVLIIEHNLDVVCQADWVIDLGPEGGTRGGEILFEGIPEDLKDAANSHTGQYLKDYF